MSGEELQLNSTPVILNGDVFIQVTTDENGVETEVPPKTSQALLQRQRERKAKSILLLAIPDEYQRRFYGIKDAKSLWAAIKSRFGGNVESKKMQKNVLKQQFENFSVSDTEGLDKAYDWFQKLISLLEVYGAAVSNEDANQNFLKSSTFILEQCSSRSSSNSQNVAFLSAEDTSSSNEVLINNKVKALTCHRRGHFARGILGTKNQGNRNREQGIGAGTNTRRILQDEQLSLLSWATLKLSSLTPEVQSCFKNCVKTYEKLQKQFDEQRQTLSKANLEIVAYQLGLESVEAHQLSAKDKTGLGYRDQLNENNPSGSELFNSVFDSRSSDGDDNQTNDRPTANKTSASVSQVETSTSQTSNTSVEMPRVESVRPSGVIIEDWVISAAKQSSLRATTSTSTFRPVNTATHTNRVNVSKLKINAFHKSHSPIRRSFYKSTALNTRISNKKVNNVRVNGVNAAGQIAVSAVKGNGVTVVKALAGCVWRPKMTNLNNVSKDNSGSWVSKRGNLQQALKNK
ncbi:hypothetical protein Tco_0470670 [Tanacetum coccineum]